MTAPKTIRVGLLSPATDANLRLIGFVQEGGSLGLPLKGDHPFPALRWWEGEGVMLEMPCGDLHTLRGVTTIGEVLQFIRLLEGGDSA